MKKLLCTVALVGMLMAPVAVQAQLVVGAAGAYHTDLEAIGIGAYLVAPLAQLHENISISGNFFYYFPDVVDAFEVNADLIWRFPVSDDTPVLPFALAGLNVFRTSVDFLGSSFSSTDIGLNLGGGVVLPMDTVRPFALAKFEIGDGPSGFVISAGAGITVGG